MMAVCLRARGAVGLVRAEANPRSTRSFGSRVARASIHRRCGAGPRETLLALAVVDLPRVIPRNQLSERFTPVRLIPLCRDVVQEKLLLVTQAARAAVPAPRFGRAESVLVDKRRERYVYRMRNEIDRCFPGLGIVRRGPDHRRVGRWPWRGVPDSHGEVLSEVGEVGDGSSAVRSDDECPDLKTAVRSQRVADSLDDARANFQVHPVAAEVCALVREHGMSGRAEVRELAPHGARQRRRTC